MAQERSRQQRDSESAELKARLDAFAADPAFRGHPLLRELERLGETHLRLLRRMEKITRISDSFQGQLKDLNESLQRASRTDHLTGLPNRRAMVDELHGEMVRSRREGAPLAVLMADVDHFKVINDTHGHEAGDRVLQALAVAMKESLRAYDVCARWGGEEFLVLLPSTDRAGALEVGEKLRKAVTGLVIPAGEAKLSVGLSVGVALLEPEETVDALLRRADAAMYEAKRQGRDRIEG